MKSIFFFVILVPVALTAMESKHSPLSKKASLNSQLKSLSERTKKISVEKHTEDKYPQQKKEEKK